MPKGMAQPARWDEAEAEILDVIHFYQSRGWRWVGIVAFIAAKAIGTMQTWPPPHPSPRVGRPRGLTRARN